MKYLTVLIVLLIPLSVSANDMILKRGSLYINKNIIYHDSLCLDRFIRQILDEAWYADAEISYLMFDCFSEHIESAISQEAINNTWIEDSLSQEEIKAWLDSIADSLWKEMPIHDTTKEYIVEIKEVCDTTFKYCCVIQRNCDGCNCHLVTCRTDTIWADKIPVYLTPEEKKWLLDIIKGLDSCFVSIYNQLVDENKKLRR